MNIGKFPQHNKKYLDKRLPRFIDHIGTHCAIGYMILKLPGYEYLPQEINKQYEYSYINDIKHNDLQKWMNQYEFNLNELSMIQPTYYGPLAPISHLNLLLGMDCKLCSNQVKCCS